MRVPARPDVNGRPAAWRCAILHGPHVANQAEAYAGLDAVGGAMGCDAAALPDLLTALAQDGARQRRMGDAARALLLARAGDPAGLLARIRDLASRARDADIRGEGV